MLKLTGRALLLAASVSLPVFSQVISAYSDKSALDSYPFIDLTDSARAHNSSLISADEGPRSERYDKPAMPPLFNEADPTKSGEKHFTERYTFNEVDSLHAKDSDLVLTGTILTAVPHLNRSRNFVYSTFTFASARVLKGSITGAKSPLLLEREGGVVLFPNQEKRFIGSLNFGLPLPGQPYLLFLQALPDHHSYAIVGGFWIGGAHVLPLDTEASRLGQLSPEELLARVQAAEPAR